ncbi:hypothetical protein B0H11DRAFT_2197793 [Mycena galericulata]|nr:hypothetical protein B0H11DRAFT_2197793 [Mycena galericulata]
MWASRVSSHSLTILLLLVCLSQASLRESPACRRGDRLAPNLVAIVLHDEHEYPHLEVSDQSLSTSSAATSTHSSNAKRHFCKCREQRFRSWLGRYGVRRRLAAFRAILRDADGPRGATAGTAMARVVGSRSYTGAHFREPLLCGAGRQRRGCERAQPTVRVRSLVVAANRVGPCQERGQHSGALAPRPLIAASPHAVLAAEQHGRKLQLQGSSAPHPQQGNAMESLTTASWARGICAVRSRERIGSTSRQIRVRPGGGYTPHGAAWCGVTREAGCLSDSRASARISPGGGFATNAYYGRPREAMRGILSTEGKGNGVAHAPKGT